MWKRLLVASLVVCVTGSVLALGLHFSKGTGAATTRVAQSVMSPVTSSRVSREYGHVPLAFEPNLGQSNGQAKFLAHGDGYSLFLTSGEAVLALRESVKSERAEHAHADVLRMRLVGANDAAPFLAIEELPGKSNYLIGNNPAEWHTNVPMYRKVAEQGIYPGVDLVYYGTQRQLEYDFIVAPQAGVTPIRLAIQGAQNERINNKGELVMTVEGGEICFQEPIAYQEAGTKRQMVAAKYALDANREVHFEVGTYDRSRALVIDPILAYSSYLGGSGIDGANAIAVASDNTSFIAGGTSSLNFPTSHPLQQNDGGSPDFPQDAFVSKFSADGSTLLYSTYLGGSSEDGANGIAVDNAGNAYVVGTTDSTDFPVTPGSFNTLCGSDGKCGASFTTGGLIVFNGFLTKLNAAGSAIVYSAFIGEFENVVAYAVAVDANQIAYVTGSTAANGIPAIVPPPVPGPTPFPITGNALQTRFGGPPTDAFMMKISATGSSILYSTYLGGDAEDVGYGIAVDKSADAYVTGLTYSPSPAGFPVSVGAFQSTYGCPPGTGSCTGTAGAGDAFFTEINTNVSGPTGLAYSTYLGGTGLDQGNGIAVDSRPASCSDIAPSGTACNAYIAGATGSMGLGASSIQVDCALDSKTPPQCEGDAFIAEFNPNLSGTASRVFFTYLGGSLADSASGVALDQTANIYVTGSTVSPDFPICAAPLPPSCAATAGPAFQAAYGGGNDDAFVAKLDASTLTLDYSSYLGGTDTDNAYGIAVDTAGSAYVAGQTCSSNFPVSNAEQVAPGGNCDAFVSKVSILDGIQLNPSTLAFPAQSLGTTSAPQTVTITNGDNTLTGFSVAMPTGPNAADFVETSTCPTTLPPGDHCAITLTFTPSAAGVSTATIALTDTASVTLPTISLTGTTSTLTLSASSLSFGSVSVGTTSTPQALVAKDDGTTALTFSSITASGDYAETDNCTKAPIQPTTTCTINVTYAPSTAGTSVGSLTINDNAPGSPQVVLLNGSGIVQQFSISAVSSTATVSAGMSASYALSITPIAGFAQPVTLACSGLPFGALCSAVPNPVTLTGTAPTQVTLTITTEARTIIPTGPGARVGPSSGVMERLELSLFAALLAIVALTARSKFKDLRLGVSLLFAVVLILISAGCNGGTQKGVPAGTPAGTYQVTITGTSGSATQSTTVNLQVN
jgi:beta-propeller repeat-containing protein/centrosomal CEP192-like protein